MRGYFEYDTQVGHFGKELIQPDIPKNHPNKIVADYINTYPVDALELAGNALRKQYPKVATLIKQTVDLLHNQEKDKAMLTESQMFTQNQIDNMTFSEVSEAIDNLARQKLFDSNGNRSYAEALMEVLRAYPKLAAAYSGPRE